MDGLMGGVVHGDIVSLGPYRYLGHGHVEWVCEYRHHEEASGSRLTWKVSLFEEAGRPIWEWEPTKHGTADKGILPSVLKP